MPVNAAPDPDPALLGIYLNDHLAGATGGLELFRRACGSHRDTEAGPVLERLTAETEADREDLLGVMRALDVPVRHYKVVGGWAAEKAGRFKLNGRLRSRSPLSSVVELEGLHLAVLGKAAGWRLLKALSDADPRLDAVELDRLHERAVRQAEEIDVLRLTAATEGLAR
jgi:hypothetical protein